MKTTVCTFLVTSIISILSLILSFHASAQYFEVTNSQTQVQQNETVFQPPALSTEIMNVPLNACAFDTLLGGFLNYDLGNACYSQAKLEGNFPLPHQISCTAGARAFVDGSNTQTMLVKWKNTVSNYSCTDTPYGAIGNSDLTLDVTLRVTGIAPGIPVTVYYQYNVFSGASTSHETDGIPLILQEDAVATVNSFTLDGTNLVGPGFSFASPGGLPGWNSTGTVYGSLATTSGTNFNVNISSNIFASIAPNPSNNICGNFSSDQNDGIFKGEIIFSLSVLYPTNPQGSEELLFSLDLGSDSDFSEPQQNGNENFDVGDVYVSGATPLPGPMDGKLDDETIFGLDPRPSNPGLTMGYHGAPVFAPSGTAYFDLDGTDNVDFSISALQVSGINFPLSYWDSECVHLAENFLISLEDDAATSYEAPAPSIPVEGSAVSGIIYGQTLKNDEVIALTLDPSFPSLISIIPFMSESQVHASLNADPLSEIEDDDVDALDIVALDATGNDLCTTWYFSSDHEVTYDPLTTGLPALDPTSVYEVLPGNGIIEVINNTDLGISSTTDLADFEFGWYESSSDASFNLLTSPTYYMAFYFSVHPDNPNTNPDESGGLDPRKIYWSILSGVSWEYTTQPMADAIDAITILDEDDFVGFIPCQQTWYQDADGDGFGNTNLSVVSCTQPTGHSATSGDCDDANPAINPGVYDDPCNFFDDNCDGIINFGNTGCTDSTACNFDPTATCDDGSCTFLTYSLFFDGDGDGYGDVMFTFATCTPPLGYVYQNGDCDDTNPAIYPGASTTHQGYDNNCDGILSCDESLPCAGDLNGDCARNVGDLLLFMSNYGCSSGCGIYDLNGDGMVNISDLLLFMALFATSCP